MKILFPDTREFRIAPRPGRIPQRAFVGIAVLLICIIGIIDLQFEPQLSSTFFYLLPVLLASRHAGLWASIACAALATSMSLYANLATAPNAGNSIIPYSDAVLRFGVLLVVVRLVRSLRSLNDSLDERVRDRTARLEAEVKERLKLESRIIEARESEQSRIGQDLHDGLCQYLVATAFSAGLLQRKLEEGGMSEAEEASDIVEMIDDSIAQARDLAKGLYPVPLEEEGLETALRDLADKTSKRTGIRCGFKGPGPPSHLDKDMAIHLYRIAQEALNNAVKHSEAKSVEIAFVGDGNRFDLRIKDDGRGLGDNPRGGGGMGLHIMEYRARSIGAVLEILPGTAGGTCVRCASAG